MGESVWPRGSSPPSRSERSPGRHRSSHRGGSPAREKHSSRAKSPRPRKSVSPAPRSPSPRTKRLRTAQSERDTERRPEREHDRHHSKRSREGSDHRDRERERETGTERRERRPDRDETNGKSSRSRHGRSESPPPDRHRRSRHRSRSPPLDSDARARQEVTNTRRSEYLDDDGDSVAKMEAAEKALEEKQKEKPSFELSGKLAAETNRVRGVTLLFTEPPDARKPDVRWRLYVFKGGEVLNEPLYIHRQSCYLFGRERRVADIPTDHPSCSKQHAVIQFRQVEKEEPDGMMSRQIKPYLMDLGSTNKTFLNENPVEPQRYYELFEKDTIKFGNSSREYVLLHENSAS
ncbi:FHA domain-containing protein DDL [Punica granatum]|uniref:FHA domain-containing protein DDL n=2 Tax=Punica granatum TaxID=22663 RepID=A0A218XUE9_PUNGR|nr:FHA domain-containing protein DDL [Punica granatum]OWM88440.1 hypothetical protein CDL15_Pgr003852 [Punica granatum]